MLVTASTALPPDLAVAVKKWIYLNFQGILNALDVA
jgi:hypothetical protein